MKKILNSTFGLKSFKRGQKEIIQSVIHGKDVFVVMPTGSGKSLCYQLPAIVREGLTVVISPLIALMMSQVLYLKKLGINCGALTSSSSPGEVTEILDNLSQKTLKILYIAPERLSKASTIKILKAGNVNLIAVDEAHCVSQWGHDFRPNYLLIGNLRKSLNVPLVALTATAGPRTKIEITKLLFGKNKPKSFYFGYDRPNIFMSFRLKSSPRDQILNFVKKNKKTSGIVYCATRAKTETIANALNEIGYSALAYHAGLESSIRRNVETLFSSKNNLIIVATIAFGMGLDKPNIRWIVHADIPQSIENYYQEIGRAGRDGKPAIALTLYSQEDIDFRRQQINEGTMMEVQKDLNHQRLNHIIGLADDIDCRRKNLLRYFGEDIVLCKNCDLCKNPKDTFEASKSIQKILECIILTNEKYSIANIINLLIGQLTDKIKKNNDQKNKFFGTGKEFNNLQWLAIIRQMMGRDLIRPSLKGVNSICLTVQGKMFLTNKHPINFNLDSFHKISKKVKIKTLVSDDDQALLSMLKANCRKLAENSNIPSHFIFREATLIEMAIKKPKNIDEFFMIHGVGPKKLEKFSTSFLNIINISPPDPLHPARRKLIGGNSAYIYDQLIEAQSKLAYGKDGHQKKITCSPSIIAKISKLINPTQAVINNILGEKKALRFGKAFLKILKDF